MSNMSFGDLASSYLLQSRGNAIKTEMSRLTEELVSGQVSDVKDALSGNYSYLTDIEANLSTLSAYKVSTAEAAQYTTTVQNVLGHINDISLKVEDDLITASINGSDNIAYQVSTEARDTLESTIEAINMRSAGRALFSGAATDQASTGDVDELLSSLRSVLTGVTGAASKATAIEAWFDDPAGYDTTFYKGSTTPIGTFNLSDTESTTLDIRATDDAIKDTLMHLSIAALASDSALGVDATERKEMLALSQEGLAAANDNIISLRAFVGYSEARIELAQTKNANETTSLEYAKGTLLEADPYKTAIRLEEIQFQLQSLFTLTAKNSQLSLVNYL